MDDDGVMRWVAGYEGAWRDGNLEALDELFSPGVSYSRAPFLEPSIGIDALKEFWREDDDETFTVQAALVANQPPTAVVRLEVHYGQPVRQQYRDLWVLHFDADGRVDHYEEWPFWPEVSSPGPA